MVGKKRCGKMELVKIFTSEIDQILRLDLRCGEDANHPLSGNRKIAKGRGNP